MGHRRLARRGIGAAGRAIAGAADSAPVVKVPWVDATWPGPLDGKGSAPAAAAAAAGVGVAGKVEQAKASGQGQGKKVASRGSSGDDLGRSAIGFAGAANRVPARALRPLGKFRQTF